MTTSDIAAVRRATDRVRERALAEGLIDIGYATLDTPIGRLLVAATAVGIVRIGFEDEGDGPLIELSALVSPRIMETPGRVDEARRQLDSYFDRGLRQFNLPLDWRLVGSFGRRVLGRVARVPYGGVESYGDVAVEIGHPRAARAVGNAVGANPMPIVVPCHRVVRTGGALGGYGGGLPRKRFLLELEGALPTSRAAARSG
ncbi:MAG: methylated-DNA--[protein]-cysteine S-methyltransferase [Chloroflexi bacterium]|nr:MAG: methylated-DNA--[protein]-cysteine S-methyltransferase [Chloroflexota bacterium]